MKTLTIEVKAECTGAQIEDEFTYEIKGDEPTDAELKEIQEEAQQIAVDGLGFSYSWEIKKQKMDYRFALFNCHINNGLEETKKKFIEIWGQKKYDEVFQPVIDKGIMSIFQKKPNKYTKFIVFYNQKIVNATTT